ncbi:MAG: arginine deiminase [Alkaliphilus sp.]
MPEHNFINVNSEIGKLKAVLLHRPGKELERLTPEYLHELLFDDIPWLKRMREEHLSFANEMQKRDCDVYYYEDLLAEAIKDESVRANFIKDTIENSNIENVELEITIGNFMKGCSPQKVVDIAITGLHKDELKGKRQKQYLIDYVKEDFPFYINPLPNLYFTRDPGVVLGNRLSINKMKTPARNRETMFLEYIYNFHPLFKENTSKPLYTYKEKYSIEGGDVLVLSEDVVAIGCSERTSARAIETLSQRLFEENIAKKVLAIQIPFTRAYMHLDTVFTMVDHDKFTIYPGINQKLRAFELTRGKVTPKVTLCDTLENGLKNVLKLPSIKLIESGGGKAITAAREQWNDSTNTLAIEPGVVITYNRNEVSNDTLRKNGIEVIEIEGSELVRGRGGPRCMSMPLIREEI